MDARSSTASTRRILLVDLDNCPGQLATLFDDLITYDRIVACHGMVEPRIPLSQVPQVAQAIASNRVEFHRMARGGKNAADFCLTFLAGRLSTSEPADTEFVVVSADTDLDHAVNLLKSLGRRARRITVTKASRAGNSPDRVVSPTRELPAVESSHPPRNSHSTEANNSPRSVEQAADRFMLDYFVTARNRPRKKQGLRNLVTMYFRKSPEISVEAVLTALFDAGYVSANAQGRLTYHEVDLEFIDVDQDSFEHADEHDLPPEESESDIAIPF